MRTLQLTWLTVWVIGAIALIAITAVVAWVLDQPSRTGRRATGVALTIVILAVTAATVLAADHAAWWWPAGVLLVGGEAAAKILSHGAGIRNRLAAARQRRLRDPGNLLSGPAHQHLRPLPPPSVDARLGTWKRLSRRVDAWLAADGPTPTAGWWHSGGLVVDREGPALLDAAGLRHPLPDGTQEMVLRLAPRALLLVDADGTQLARLPLTGFTPAGLRDYCDATGWHFRTGDGGHRPAPELLDLQRAVVDPAAR